MSTKLVVVTEHTVYTSKFFLEVPVNWTEEEILDAFSERDVADLHRPFKHGETTRRAVAFSGDAEGCPNAEPIKLEE